MVGANRLTYGELNASANRLAHFLRQRGIRPGSLVGVYLDRSPEMVVALLAILKSGGAYFPLDPKFPQHRLAFMLEDAEAPLVLTQLAKKESSAGRRKSAIVLLDDEESAFQDFPSSNPAPVNQPADLAYVIYTSGSTGNPKGVMIPRHALINFLHGMREAPGLRARDVLLAITTISFDISILELLLPLTAGAQMVVATRAAGRGRGRIETLARTALRDRDASHAHYLAHARRERLGRKIAISRFFVGASL